MKNRPTSSTSYLKHVPHRSLKSAKKVYFENIPDLNILVCMYGIITYT